jgi:hypothetical protein
LLDVFYDDADSSRWINGIIKAVVNHFLKFSERVGAARDSTLPPSVNGPTYEDTSFRVFEDRFIPDVNLNLIPTGYSYQLDPPMQTSIVVKFIDLSWILASRDRAYERRVVVIREFKRIEAGRAINYQISHLALRSTRFSLNGDDQFSWCSARIPYV